MKPDESSALRRASPEAIEALGFTRRRRLVAYLNVCLTSALLLGTVVMVNVVAREHGRRYNWTVDKIEDLQPDTVQRLKAVDRDINVLVNVIDIGAFGQDRCLPEVARLIREMLREFERQSSRIKVTVAEEAGNLPPWVNKAVIEPNTLYLYNEGLDQKPNTRTISLRELYLGDPSSGEIVDFRAETMLISAIWTMVSSKKKVVYCIEGHDENHLDVVREQGLSLLASGLRERDNVDWRQLNLEQERQVPRDADMLFVAGARRDFTRGELDVLRDYLEEGGRVLVAIEPLSGTPEFRRFLEAWGARAEKGVVHDGSHVGNATWWLRVRSFGRHRINADSLSPDFWIDMPVTAPVRPVDVPDRRLEIASLFRSSRDSFVDVNGNQKPDENEPKQGNFDLAVAVEGEASKKPRFSERPRPRLVVLGSVNAFTNYYNQARLGVNDYTAMYHLNTFRWLLELEQVITPLAPKRPQMKILDLNPGAKQQIAWISIGFLPLLGVILGVIAWWFRRK